MRDDVVCRRYHGGIIRREHEHYIVIYGDKIIASVDYLWEAEQEIDDWEDNHNGSTQTLD